MRRLILDLVTKFESGKWYTRILIVGILVFILVMLYKVLTPAEIKDSEDLKPAIIQSGDHNAQNNNFN